MSWFFSFLLVYFDSNSSLLIYPANFLQILSWTCEWTNLLTPHKLVMNSVHWSPRDQSSTQFTDCHTNPAIDYMSLPTLPTWLTACSSAMYKVNCNICILWSYHSAGCRVITHWYRSCGHRHTPRSCRPDALLCFCPWAGTRPSALLGKLLQIS